MGYVMLRYIKCQLDSKNFILYDSGKDIICSKKELEKYNGKGVVLGKCTPYINYISPVSNQLLLTITKIKTLNISHDKLDKLLYSKFPPQSKRFILTFDIKRQKTGFGSIYAWVCNIVDLYYNCILYSKELRFTSDFPSYYHIKVENGEYNIHNFFHLSAYDCDKIFDIVLKDGTIIPCMHCNLFWRTPSNKIDGINLKVDLYSSTILHCSKASSYDLYGQLDKFT